MASSSEILLALIRHSLWSAPVGDISVGLTDEEWNDVYDLSRRHAVQGVAYDAFRDMPKGHGPGVRLAARWMMEVNRISERYSHIKDLTEKMTLLWQRLGINAVHLKGVRLAAMYPVPSHRVCGDIDWYFADEKDREAATTWALRKGLSPMRDSDGTVGYSLDGVMVEHHRLPFTPGDPMEDLVMLNLHILKHALVQGVGLRQICDLAVAYRYHAGRYSVQALHDDLEKKKLLRWTDLLHRLLVDYVGMPLEFLPWPLEAGGRRTAERDVSRLLDLVVSDGNFGLSKTSPRSGFVKRCRIFLKYSPERFVNRWIGLIFGRIFKRKRIR